jgi:hypothetical protein
MQYQEERIDDPEGSSLIDDFADDLAHRVGN